MPLVTLRHFTEEDIPVRTALLRETRFQANLNDLGVVTSDEALAARQRKSITEEHDIKRLFTICGPGGDIVGFAWITSIDWRSQCCELSFAVLPRYRGAFGAAAVGAAHAHIRAELNMRVVVNQVLEHNTMLVSTEELAERRAVRCPWDSYTLGEWRTACYWTDSEEDVRRSREKSDRRRREIAARIRSGGRT
ncbi:GNAT family N-acetyltransferase [Streptomyces alkaliphilus]|uniref:GNAT family N-acetyltransferase n=1 Tax=Streptomyces alkaliphilus TaxID=1472722 RepID=A0A7W3TFY8_9ACTN|nr:GNAT family N-acetyltransferase [Streptomyces alkaliphilus]MBB0246062.1 GNAT family N-acetyltransferase [Streptomyces alkaliphilus]